MYTTWDLGKYEVNENYEENERDKQIKREI